MLAVAGAKTDRVTAQLQPARASEPLA